MLKIIGIVVVVIIVLVGLGAGSVFLFSSKAKEAAVAFLTDTANGQIEQAYNSTAVSFKEIGTLEQFKNMVAGQKSLTGFAKANFSSINMSGDITKLNGTITTKDGGVYPIFVELIKEGGLWKVSSFSTK